MRVKKFRPRESRDKLIYGDGIVEGIVLLAVSEIPYAEIYRGVGGKRPAEDAVKVVIDKSNVSVDVVVSIHYSQCVSDMAFKIQEAVKYNVESMTDYNVVSVNVSVNGVMFEDVVLNNNGNGDETNGNGDLKSDVKSDVKADAADQNGSKTVNATEDKPQKKD
ncbi:MAG: Asp23/Gls24 family envelope stress response protein [Clostridia bacterium]|nr:Asp23/Gls24 family envelope stress response protein [Clostridia bacterium]